MGNASAVEHPSPKYRNSKHLWGMCVCAQRTLQHQQALHSSQTVGQETWLVSPVKSSNCSH